MVTCERIQAHLNDFLDGTLAATEAQELNAHLQECGACRAEYRALKATLELVRGVPAPYDRETRQRVMARFQHEVAPAPTSLGTAPSFQLPVWRLRLMCKHQKSAQTCLAKRLTSGCGEGTSSGLMPFSAAVVTVALLGVIGLPFLRHERPKVPAGDGPIVLTTASCNASLPTADDLDQMVSAHAVQSLTVQNGSEEAQQEALADANSRLR
jgi:predicted anti-sigma-YlaC factor YlaD